MKLRTAALFSLLGAALLFGQRSIAAELAVIDLHNRTADELVPVLKPVAGNASLSGMDYKLIVRGEPADIQRIRQLLVTLDRAPKSLLISVRYLGRPELTSSELRGYTTVDGSGGEFRADGRATRSTGSDSSVSSVRVLEGNGALISTGQSVPIVSAMFISGGRNRGNAVGVSTEFRETSSGFTVIPRLNGDRVLLELSAQSQRLGSQGSGSVTTDRATTTLSGKLGEWIELGGIAQETVQQSAGIATGSGSRRITTQSDQRRIAVKVEPAD